MDSLQVLLGNFSIIIATPHHFAVSQAGFQVKHKVILECSTDQYCLAILAMPPGGKIEPLGFVDFALQAVAVIAAAVVIVVEGGVAQVSSQDLGNATKALIVNVIAIAWQLLEEDGINFKYVSFVTLSIAVHKCPSLAVEGVIIKEESCCLTIASTVRKKFGLASVIIEWAVVAVIAADELLGLI